MSIEFELKKAAEDYKNIDDGLLFVNNGLISTLAERAFIAGGQYIIDKWRDALYDYIVDTTYTNAEERELLKKYGL